jgi:hypothetical protein
MISAYRQQRDHKHAPGPPAGYQTSIFAASALGQNSFSRNYGGVNYLLWNGSWAQVDRNITNFVTRFRDQNGTPDHPETPPHNPWPN